MILVGSDFWRGLLAWMETTMVAGGLITAEDYEKAKAEVLKQLIG